MTACRRLRSWPVIVALVALSVVGSVPMAQAAPLSEGAVASGATVPQSGTCPGGRQQGGHCLPGGSGSPAGSGSTPTPPSERPPATRLQGAELPLIIMGWAKATLHIHDDDHDVIYSAYHDRPGVVETGSVEKVPLLFIRRMVQDMPGATQYILASGEEMGNLHVIWKAEGREFDCTVKGKAIVPLHTDRGGNPLVDPINNHVTQPGYGYLNVVGRDGGDFHSVIIKAFSNEPNLIKTCPGDPPLVTEDNFQAGFLLHILWQKNTREDGRVSFKGQQTYDMNNPLGLLDMLPPGENQERARQFLNSAETSGTSVRYTWEWELFPVVPAR